MRTEMVTADNIEELRRSHGEPIRIGDEVEVREPEVFDPSFRIYPETVSALEYMEDLRNRAHDRR